MIFLSTCLEHKCRFLAILVKAASYFIFCVVSGEVVTVPCKVYHHTSTIRVTKSVQ